MKAELAAQVPRYVGQEACLRTGHSSLQTPGTDIPRTFHFVFPPRSIISLNPKFPPTSISFLTPLTIKGKKQKIILVEESFVKQPIDGL